MPFELTNEILEKVANIMEKLVSLIMLVIR